MRWVSMFGRTRKSVAGRGNSMCKGPELRDSLVNLKKKEPLVLL